MIPGWSLWPLHNTCRSKVKLVGKTVVVTGGNTGIGKEVLRDVYKRGARCIMMCRDLKKGQEAIEDIEKTSSDGERGEFALYQLNLASLASVRECAKKVLQTESAVHILINNAGIMAHPFAKTEDGLEYHFQVNHLGHFLLTLLLLPKLQASAPGCRIINVGSLIHILGDIHFDDINMERGYKPLKGYAQSKLANVLFTKELAARLEEDDIKGINVYTLHPGVVKTELGRYTDNTVFYGARFLTSVFMYLGLVKSPTQGAQTTLHCAVDEEAGKETGLYYCECKVTKTSSKANDPDRAKRLWDLSCNLLDVDPKLKLSELAKSLAVKSFGSR